MNEQCVLVVEDHGALLGAIEDILTTEGYTVLVAGDGVEALEVMEEGAPDLIVADIMMPRMDGYELYERVRARPQWIPIPFIFLTAKAERGDVLKGKALGAEDYLTKPFDPQELLVAVRARLGRAQDIRASAEAELDQLKSQIVTVLGHELRTPLTYVLGYTDLALEDASSFSADDLRDLLHGIKQGADRLTQLVESFLLLIRIDTGQAAEEYGLLAQPRSDLKEIIEQVVDQYKDRAEAAGVALEADLGSALPAVQLCEPFFVNALGRLLDNGIKFSRGKGAHVEIVARAAGKWVEVAVRDDGVGIPAAELSCLFERFRQIDREKSEQQGAGLGLAIASDLIRLHGGELIAESEVGQGSTFVIRLPADGTT